MNWHVLLGGFCLGLNCYNPIKSVGSDASCEKCSRWDVFRGLREVPKISCT